MTADDPETLRRLLANARALLLDFDGPVCSIFAGLPAPTIAAELRDLVAAYGAPMPIEQLTDDPHQVLRYAATISHNLSQVVEARLTIREIDATATASATPHVERVLKKWVQGGRPIGIASNNAAQAVGGYLARHHLSHLIDHIEGRAKDPALLKPNPYLIVRTCRRIGVEPAQGVYIGDSVSDRAAAKIAHTPFIGYANEPNKFAGAMANDGDVVVSSMRDVYLALG